MRPVMMKRFNSQQRRPTDESLKQNLGLCHRSAGRFIQRIPFFLSFFLWFTFCYCCCCCRVDYDWRYDTQLGYLTRTVTLQRKKEIKEEINKTKYCPALARRTVNNANLLYTIGLFGLFGLQSIALDVPLYYTTIDDECVWVCCELLM